MKRSKFTELRARVEYIQSSLDELHEIIKEEELVDNINTKEVGGDAAVLSGSTVNNIEEYDEYSVCENKPFCINLKVVGITALTLIVVYLLSQ
jgi:hypothetical protein